MPQTVAHIFSSLGLVQWWDAPDTQDFNHSTEWGTDYGLPPNKPIGAIKSGRVVYAGQDPNHIGSSLGYIVQVESADGSLVHYQHLRSAAVQKGDTVQVGQAIGTSGGCPANGYSPGGGCSYTDQFSTGPHIEVRYSPTYNPSAGVWNQQWVNPVNIFKGIAQGGILNALDNQTAASSQGNCTHSISLPGGTGVCLDSGLELLIRSGIALAGAALIILAIIIFASGNSHVREGASGLVSNAQKAAEVAAI